MRYHFPLLAVFFIIIAIVLSGFYSNRILSIWQGNSKEVFSPSPSVYDSPDQPSPTATPDPQNPQHQNPPGRGAEINLITFQYPGSLVITKSNTKLELESMDDVSQITLWYKNILSNYQAKSFVSTVANGKVQTMLTASNNNGQIKIEISKPSTSERVEIVVTHN
jgi:hypothetical protein